MKFIHHHGGRAAAGYKGSAGDCVTRAIAIATELPYQEVYDALNALCKTVKQRKHSRVGGSSTGITRPVYEQYLKSLGWKWQATMGIGVGCSTHMIDYEVPKGRVIVRVSKYLAAVIDGVLHDTQDCSRGGTRCVYGYFIREE